jgi:hypothetical protein
MKQVASLRYGVIFKKAFCDVSVFKGFVRDIVGIELDIERVETEKVFDSSIGSVKTEFDLFAEDKTNRIIVDIQHQRHADHYDRFLHYHCVALLEQIKNSNDYQPNLTVYTIVVLTSGDKHKKDILITDFSPRDLNDKAIHEISHKIIFLCPKYVTENTPPPYREWLSAIEDSLDGEVDETHYHTKEIQTIFEHIARNTISPQEKARMIEEYHQEEAINAEALKVKKTIVDNMLINGLSINTIAQLTGLNLTEIEFLNTYPNYD